MNPIRSLNARRAARRIGRPGESAMERFRRARMDKVRNEWRLFAGTIAYIAVAATLVVVTHGGARTVFAATLGSGLTLLLFFWAIGDVHALPWVWGSVGEQQTGDLLEQLPAEWIVEHDVPNGDRSNWDHILIGPAGVFALDSKNLSRTSSVVNDALRASGRLVFSGGAFRGSARALHDTLEARGARPPYVQAVVVIWGDFPQRCHEEERVVYLAAAELLRWIKQQPARIPAPRVSALAAAVGRLRAAAY